MADLSTAPRVYRFKFCKDVLSALTEFSSHHQDSTRIEFQDEWEKWLTENKELVDGEERRLVNMGFEGNISEKMYKSARYYYTKKAKTPSEAKAPVRRREYVKLNKEMLSMIDAHLETGLTDNKATFKPSHGYNDFISTHNAEYESEVSRLLATSDLSRKDAEDKMKKTYKNRYYVMTHRSVPIKVE